MWLWSVLPYIWVSMFYSFIFPLKYFPKTWFYCLNWLCFNISFLLRIVHIYFYHWYISFSITWILTSSFYWEVLCTYNVVLMISIIEAGLKMSNNNNNNKDAQLMYHFFINCCSTCRLVILMSIHFHALYLL